jgi:hypothetical protein
MPQGLITASRFRSRDPAADDRQPGVAVPNPPTLLNAQMLGQLL